MARPGVTVPRDGISIGFEGDLKSWGVECDRFPHWTFSLDIAPHGKVTRFEAVAPAGMTARELQGVPLGSLCAAVAQRAVEDARSDVQRAGAAGNRGSSAFFRYWLDIAESMPAVPIDGRRDDAWYAVHVALPYAQAEQLGSSNPSQAVEEHLSELGVALKPTTVRGLVHNCRHRRKLLPPTEHGRAGSGGLTRKAERILMWIEEEG